MITEPRWKSYIVETTTPLFTPQQCQDYNQGRRSEPKQDAVCWRVKIKMV